MARSASNVRRRHRCPGLNASWDVCFAGSFGACMRHARMSSSYRCDRVALSSDGKGRDFLNVYSRLPVESPKRIAIFLHDFLTDGRLFTGLSKTSQLASTLLIAPDLRGHGRSSIPNRVYSHAEDLDIILQNYLTTTTPLPVHVVGSGLGGAHALEYALARGKGNVLSAALFSSGLPGHQWKVRHFYNISMARRAGRKMLGVGAYEDEVSEEERNVRKWTEGFIGMNETWKNALTRDGDAECKALLTKMARDYEGFHFFFKDPVVPGDKEQLLCYRLKFITQKVLVMVGEQDTQDFKKIAAEIAQGVHSCYTGKEISIPGAGHFPTLQAPLECAMRLVEFWEHVEAEQTVQAPLAVRNLH